MLYFTVEESRAKGRGRRDSLETSPRIWGFVSFIILGVREREWQECDEVLNRKLSHDLSWIVG